MSWIVCFKIKLVTVTNSSISLQKMENLFADLQVTCAILTILFLCPQMSGRKLCIR